jgi:multidrug efflux pump subunit AcrB
LEKVIRYFAENKLVVNLLVIIIIVVGIYSVYNLKQDVFPPTDIDTMIVTVIYPGASPADVELNAVVPIENEIRNIQGIKDFVSLSVENGATIYVYLDQDTPDKQKVKDEVYRNLSNVSDLAPEVEDIVIHDANPKLMSVYTFGVSGKAEADIGERELNQFVDSLEERLLRVKGVAEIRKSGYRDREIRILISPKKMERYYISLNDIVKSIQTRNIRATGGTIQSIQKEQTIVTIGQFENPLDVRDVIIRSNFERRSIKVRDIGNVKDGFKKKDIEVRVNKEDGITMSVVKKEDADVVKTVKNVKRFLEENVETFPGGIKVTTIDDRSLSIISLLKVVQTNAFIGFGLVFFILLLFLDFRTSFWTAFGIPLTIFMILTYLYVADLSINLITLGAIITVLGMLVDHGIVISESIYNYKLEGLSSLEATIKGIKDVIAPVTITILTTIVAFLPMLYIGGTMGKFIYLYPIIIGVALIASFFEAMFILPNHLSHGRQKRKKRKDRFAAIADLYQKFLNGVLRIRYVIIFLFFALAAGTFYYTQDTIKNFVLLWENTSDAFFINLEAEEGTSLSRTSEFTKKIEDIVMKKVKDDERVSIRTAIGHHTVKRTSSKGNHENWAQVAVYLIPKTERIRTVEEVMQSLKKDINVKKIKEFKKITFSKQVVGPSPGSAVDIKIVGKDEEAKKKVQGEIEDYLASLPGVMDIDNDQKFGKEELKINFDYEKLAQFELNVESVAQAVRTAYEGSIATSIQTTDQKLDFRVEIEDTYKRDIKFLKNLLIPNAQGRLIKLGQFATISTQKGKTIINHYNGESVITITASVNKEMTTSTKVTQLVKQRFQNVPKEYPGTFLQFKGEAEETAESLQRLIIAFIIAILLIYFLLILLFKSLGQPIIILLTIPFGIIGVLLAFKAHGMPLSFMGIIGIIGLTGVVVNDSVVMVSFINRVIKSDTGQSTKYYIQKITEGAKKRLRPIILTTLTTVAGLIPTVYGIGGDAKTLVPVVMAMAYGLLFATLLTLIFVPAIYMVSMDIKKLFLRNG